MDYAIIEVEGDLAVGDLMEPQIILTAIIEVFGEAFEVATLGRGEFGLTDAERIDAGFKGVDIGQQVMVADGGHGEGIHAVHVGDGLECAFLAAEEPVDGTLLVPLYMVFPEVLGEVVFEGLAQG